MDVVEIQKVAVRASLVAPAIPAVKAHGSNLHRVVGDSMGVVDWVLIKRIQTVGHVEVVVNFVGSVMTVAVPVVAVDVRGVEQRSVFTSKISHGDSPWTSRINLWEGR